MASLKDNTTNATILRDHVLNMRHVFEKFQTKHALALAKTAETPVTNATPLKSITTAESAPTKNEADLLEEISRLKEQLREKDKMIEALQTNKWNLKLMVSIQNCLIKLLEWQNQKKVNQIILLTPILAN